tara:strand:- start:398 stop:574 length:177 start_codon:yes stop_codon:yes gene_type:complete
MKIGDLVKVTIESGITDIGIITSINNDLGELWYEVACQTAKAFCIATEDMLEVICEAG